MKKLNLLLISLFFIGLVIAGGSFIKNRNVRIDSREYDEIGINSIYKTDCIKINDDYCMFKMWNGTENHSNYGLGFHKIALRTCINNDPKTNECLEYNYYNNNQITSMAEEKADKFLNRYSGVLNQRRLNNTQIIPTKEKINLISTK